MRFLMIAILIVAGCAHEEKRPEEKRLEEKTEKIPVSQNPSPDAGASIETKQVAAESNARFSTEIRFKKGDSTLSKESKGRLAKLLNSARKIGEVDEIHTYAWADQEYPGEQAKKLPPKEQGLARARGEAIQSYYAQIDGGLKDHVKVITMTERPEGLNEKLKLGNTREKNAFTEAGIATTEPKKSTSPKASRAAVMIILKK